MLFISVYTWNPEDTQKVIDCRMKEEIPEGVKILGEWADLGGSQSFRLFEVAEPKALIAMTSLWFGLGHNEIIPVMEVEEGLKLLASR